MALRLEYPDKYRLWSELVQGNSDRVFVSTDESQRLGSRVPVELSHGTVPPVVLLGTVVGLRAKSLRFEGGVYVRFADDEMDKCRRLLGLARPPERFERGRKAKRVPCHLKVRVRSPRSPEAGIARDISELGMLLSCPVPVDEGQCIELELQLDDGSTVELNAEVARHRAGEPLVGLRFLDLSPETTAKVGGCVERLMAKLIDAPREQAIVLADDDPTVLEFLHKALSRYGYNLHKARRGEEALALIRELKPKMVILDILIPGIDGVAICRMMRADVDLAEVPVIYFSALDEVRLHAVAHDAGATDYLVKPCDLSVLINLVGSYLRQAL